VPPLTIAVYVVAVARATEGVRTAVRVALVYDTEAATTEFDGSNNWNVLVLMVARSSASLKVAVTLGLVLTPVEPFVGETAVTVGGVVSLAVELNATSTQ
jgi:hypothetical protein